MSVLVATPFANSVDATLPASIAAACAAVAVPVPTAAVAAAPAVAVAALAVAAAVAAVACAAVCPTAAPKALPMPDINDCPTTGRIYIIAIWPTIPILPINFPKLLKALLIPLPIDLKPFLTPFHALLKNPIMYFLRSIYLRY